MNAIYEGAEFTIVATVGDARTGLPGMTTTPRKRQTWIELMERSQTTDASLINNSAISAPDPYIRLLGVTKEEHEEAGKDRNWLDVQCHGFRQHMKLDLSEYLKDNEIRKTYEISYEHLKVFRDFADDCGESTDEWMVKMKQMAQDKGMPLQELAPYTLKDIATR